MVAILGLIGTAGGAIAGVVITQRRSDARDRASWERERARERERWAREDATRTFDLRREAYVEFYTAVNRQRFDLEMVHYRQMRPPKGELPRPSHELNAEVNQARQKVGLYGSSVVVEAAEKVQAALWLVDGMLGPKSPSYEWVLAEEGLPNHQNFEHLRAEEAELLHVIRADLGIPIGDIEKAEG